MANRMGALFVATLASLFGLIALARESGAPRWLKGNTHTHTLWSDGDAAPQLAADWYKSRGYQFLVLSDHNIVADQDKWKRIGIEKGEMRPETLEPLIEKFGKESVELREKDGRREMKLKTHDELRKAFEEKDKFILIPGEEISDKFGNRPIHHNSMNHTHVILPPGGDSVRDVLEKTIRTVEEEARKSGRPILVHLNHPNFGWGVTAEDIAHVAGERFFEVYNGHRGVRNYGDAEHIGCEAIWDYVLTLRLGKIGGPPLYAFATDDAHNYHKEQMTANPGRGWIMVRADRLDADSLIKAMNAGDFYASSGVVLEDVSATRNSLKVRIARDGDATYTTKFIGSRPGGKPGEVLQETPGLEAAYAFKGDELYVRAVVVSNQPHPNGYEKTDLKSAWVQPVVVRRTSK